MKPNLNARSTVTGRGPQGAPIKANRTYGHGRVCLKEDCTTKLNTYNASDMCSKHRPARFRRSRP